MLLTSTWLQVKYNVLDRAPEKSGLLQLCRDLDVALVAHSPLQQGLLTGAHAATELCPELQEWLPAYSCQSNRECALL